MRSNACELRSLREGSSATLRFTPKSFLADLAHEEHRHQETAMPRLALRHSSWLRCAPTKIVLLLALVCALLARDSSASAQAGHAQTYEQVVNEATREFSMGNFVEARALFLQAHELNANARTLRGLAKVEFELRNYLRCLEYVEASLRSEVRPLTPAMREDVEQLGQRARAFVATVEFKLSPEDARVQLEGEGRELTGSGSIQLEVGAHVAVVDAPGYQTARERIEITGSQLRVVEISLAAVASVRPSEVAAAAPSSGPATADADLKEQTIKRRRRWGWSVAAVVVAAGAAVGLAYALRDPKESPPDMPTGGSSGIVLTFSEGRR